MSEKRELKKLICKLKKKLSGGDGTDVENQKYINTILLNYKKNTSFTLVTTYIFLKLYTDANKVLDSMKENTDVLKLKLIIYQKQKSNLDITNIVVLAIKTEDITTLKIALLAISNGDENSLDIALIYIKKRSSEIISSHDILPVFILNALKNTEPNKLEVFLLSVKKYIATGKIIFLSIATSLIDNNSLKLVKCALSSDKISDACLQNIEFFIDSNFTESDYIYDCEDNECIQELIDSQTFDSNNSQSSSLNFGPL